MNQDFLPLEINSEKVYSGFWKRLAAGLIDAVLLIGLIFGLYALLNPSPVITVLILLVINFSFVAYSVYFNYRFGGTAGKLLVGIRITRPDGSRIGLKNALLRSLVDFIIALGILACDLISVVITGTSGFEMFQFSSNVDLLGSEYPS